MVSNIRRKRLTLRPRVSRCNKQHAVSQTPENQCSNYVRASIRDQRYRHPMRSPFPVPTIVKSSATEFRSLVAHRQLTNVLSVLRLIWIGTGEMSLALVVFFRIDNESGQHRCWIPDDRMEAGITQQHLTPAL